MGGTPIEKIISPPIHNILLSQPVKSKVKKPRMRGFLLDISLVNKSFSDIINDI